MAEPVLLISSDPSLAAGLQAMGRGRLPVDHLDPARLPAAWPADPAATVVLDVASGGRAAVYRWVRRHHAGVVVVVLQPGEGDAKLPPDPARLVVRRPFRIAELAEALVDRPPAPAVRAAAATGAAGLGPAGAGAARAGSATPGPGATGASRLRTRDLLQASAEQRRRRLGSLATSARVAAPPAAPAAEGLPRPDWPTAATQLDRRRRRRRRRVLKLVSRLLVGLLVVAAVAAAWLAFGLLEANDDLRVGAAAVRAELARAEVALQRDQPAAAQAALAAASRNLEFAAAVPERRELRVAAHLPLLSSGVGDARHLLASARTLTGAGERAVAVTTRLRSGGGTVAQGGRFDLDALGDTAAQARALLAELERARGELRLVRGGLFAPGVDEARRWMLARVEAAQARAGPAVATLEALPAALGAGGPRDYLVVLTSPAELRPSGGVPLAAVQVTLDRGSLQVRSAGAELVGDLDGPTRPWTAEPGDPWAPSGGFTDLSLATSSPHFPTAARELLRALQAQGGPRPDGVVALDPLAVRALLQATGPVVVPGHGRLEARGCVRQLGRDAYLRFPDPVQRRRYHQAVVGAVATRLLGGRDPLATARVLGAAGPRRYLQVYMVDAGLQRLLAGHRMDGSLADTDGDYLAVHTLNRNRSRVDLFQRRLVRQVVRLAGDGSAEVSRVVKVINAVPAGEPVSAGVATGPGSARAAAVLATYLPPGAQLTSATLDGVPVTPAMAGERGRPLLRVQVDLGPGRSATLAVDYRLGQALTRHDGGWRYRLAADPQALAEPAALRVEVVAPPAMAIDPAPGWTVRGATAVLARPFVDPLGVALDLHG